jgi:hypothetical protein
MARIEASELVGREVSDPATATGGALEGGVVVDDHDPVSREVHVELEAVGTKREAVVERRNRVFGTERRPTPVSVHDRPQASGRQRTILVEFV